MPDITFDSLRHHADATLGMLRKSAREMEEQAFRIKQVEAALALGLLSLRKDTDVFRIQRYLNHPTPPDPAEKV